MASKPIHLVGDCLGMTNSVTKLKTEGVPIGVHAGLLKDAAKGDKLQNVEEITWMPSHRVLHEGATESQRIMHRGNQNADEAAGEARKEAEELVGTELLEKASDTCKLATRILKATGTVLAAWPPLPRCMER